MEDDLSGIVVVPPFATGCTAAVGLAVGSLTDDRGAYDWSQMPAGVTSGGYDRVTGRRLTAVQADNIGRLLRDVGYTIKMDYNPSFTGGSGAFVYDVPRALREHFGYKNRVLWQERAKFTTPRWQQEVHDEMRDYGPVIYAGYSRGGGHCFVLDGFANDGYVHVDWGWNGSSNGWHLLDVLEPGSHGIGGGVGAFNSGHQMLRFVEPDRNNPDPDPDPVDEKVGESLYIHAKSTATTLAQANNQPVTVTIGNKNTKTNYSGALALAVYREGDTSATIVSTANVVVPANGTKAVTFYANLTNVKAGKYSLAVSWKDGSNYRTINAVAGTVTIGNVGPEPDPDPDPVVTGPVLHLESTVKAKGEARKSVKVEIPVTNTGDQDYNNYLKLYAVSRTNYSTTLISGGDVKIAKSQRAVVTFYSNEAYKQLPAGNYYLKLSYNKNNKEEFFRVSNTNLIGDLEITKQEEVQPVSHDIKMSTAMFYQNGYYLGQDYSTMNKKSGNLTARVYLKSTNGFKGQIYVYLTPYYNGNTADNGLGGYQNIEVGPNISGYVNVVFTSSLMRYSQYYVNILYKAEGATGWSYYPGDAVPFYVTGFYEYKGDGVNNPTMGPTFDFDEMPSESTQASIVVGSDTDGGDVTAISEFGETTAEFGVTCNGDLYIISDKAGVVGIYTTAGAKVMTVNVKAGMNKIAGSALANGMYVAKMGNKAMKFVKK